MKLLIKIILLLTFMSELIFACTLCSTQVPITVRMNENITKEATIFKVQWIFDKFFTKQIMQSYPAKYDNKFKIQDVKKSLEKYIDKKNHLTVITYDNNKIYNINKILKPTLDIKYNRFIYTYSFKVDIPQKQRNNLNIKFEDNEKFFLFHFNQQNIIDKSQPKQSEFIKLLTKILEDFTTNIKELLSKIDKSNSYQAYIWLLIFSFGYGIIHAIGPGHGKSLISSYFLTEKSSHLKALSMAGLIGVVHTFSAFILTFVIYYSVNTFLGSYFNDVETIATKVSAVIIIAIALFLIYKKISKHKHQSSCECTGCKTHSTDIGVILGAGIVPCAGTVTIFIYTMSLNLYFIGFLSAIFMSLGMSLIIYITALLSIKIRDKASSNTKLIKFFEYGSLAFILSLGVILLIV